MKCRIEKRRQPRGKAVLVILNNGKIEFTYKEAKARWGMSEGVFREARDRLIEVGLIDIAGSGAGLFKVKNLYAISDRWEAYGTDEFRCVERPKANRHIGYQKRNVGKLKSKTATGIEAGAGPSKAPPPQSPREWLSIEGVGMSTRPEVDAKSSAGTTKEQTAPKECSRGPLVAAASEKTRGFSAGRVEKPMRLSIAKPTLVMDPATEKARRELLRQQARDLMGISQKECANG
jgi:hypothetical protein